MISALTGELRQVDEDRVHLQVGPMLCELLVPAADVSTLRGQVGEELTFHTIFYLEGDSSGGNIEPRLVGFLRAEDRAFFQLFITVKGIGPKKALRALILPVGEIAQAIESKDARALCELPQIGKRMAELIVAELAGKVEKFAMNGYERAGGVRTTPFGSKRTPAEEDAIAALVALGERRSDAEHLLDRAKHANPKLKTTNEFVNDMLRMRTVRA
jgi:Holliday junction DNA helicase RuvA